MYSKTYIRARLHSLVSDREWCMNAGKIEKTMERMKACQSLRTELDWTTRQGLNAHTALVRRNATAIRLLANSLGAKVNLKGDVLEMVDELCGGNRCRSIEIPAYRTGRPEHPPAGEAGVREGGEQLCVFS